MRVEAGSGNGRLEAELVSGDTVSMVGRDDVVVLDMSNERRQRAEFSMDTLVGELHQIEAKLAIQAKLGFRERTLCDDLRIAVVVVVRWAGWQQLLGAQRRV